MSRRRPIPPALSLLAALPLALALGGDATAQSRVGEVSTTFRLVGPNDKVTVIRFKKS